MYLPMVYVSRVHGKVVLSFVICIIISRKPNAQHTGVYDLRFKVGVFVMFFSRNTGRSRGVTNFYSTIFTIAVFFMLLLYLTTLNQITTIRAFDWFYDFFSGQDSLMYQPSYSNLFQIIQHHSKLA